MEDDKDIVARLQAVDISWSETGELCAEAATRIQSDAATIAALRGEVERLTRLVAMDTLLQIDGPLYDAARAAMGGGDVTDRPNPASTE